MKCHNVKAVIRFHKPQKTLHPEKYFHHKLMLYLPWRNETELIGPAQTYALRFSDPSVTTTVRHNQLVFEPFGETVDEALEFVQNNP